MQKNMYNKGKQENKVTHFTQSVLKNYQLKVGFLIKTDHKLEIFPDDLKMELIDMQRKVGGYIELYPSFFDENFDIIIDEEGILKEKPFNLMAFFITGLTFYGDVLILRKGILK